jgi:hypothetical protein
VIFSGQLKALTANRLREMLSAWPESDRDLGTQRAFLEKLSSSTGKQKTSRERIQTPLGW